MTLANTRPLVLLDCPSPDGHKWVSGFAGCWNCGSWRPYDFGDDPNDPGASSDLRDDYEAFVLKTKSSDISR